MLLVFLCGGAGATARVFASEWLERRYGEQVPFVGLLLVNLVGCLLIGVAAESTRDPLVKAAVMGGLLGGFTTFSAFGLMSLELGQAGRWSDMALQIGAHVAGGILAVFAGMALARTLGWSGI